MRLTAALLGEVLDSGLRSAFTAPVLQIRAGPMPAGPDSAAIGSLLCEIVLPETDYFSSPVLGAIGLQGSWSGVVTGDGTAGWFRIKNASDNNGAYTNRYRIDGSLGIDGDVSADMTLSAITLAVNDTLDILTFSMGIEQTGFQFGSSGISA